MTSIKVQPYDGTTDPEEWCDRFRTIKIVKGDDWGPDDNSENGRAGNEIKIAMSGKMAKWIKTVPNARWANYENVLTDIISYVRGPYYIREKREKALKLTSEDFESVVDYVNEKIQVLKEIYPNDNQVATIIELLIDGMRPQIKEWIYLKDAGDRDTLDKVKVLAQGFERVFGSKDAHAEKINALNSEFHEDRLRLLEEKLVETQSKLKTAKDQIEKMKKIKPPYPKNRQNGGTQWTPMPPSYQPPPMYPYQTGYPPTSNFSPPNRLPCTHCGSFDHIGPSNIRCPRHNPRFRGGRVRGNRSGGRTQGNRKPPMEENAIICHNCGGKGHTKNQCPSTSDKNNQSYE